MKFHILGISSASNFADVFLERCLWSQFDNIVSLRSETAVFHILQQRKAELFSSLVPQAFKTSGPDWLMTSVLLIIPALFRGASCFSQLGFFPSFSLSLY